MVAALSRNRTLLTVELGTNGLSDLSAQHIGDTLRLNNTLEGLSLWQNEIGGPGAQCLAEGLQVHTFSVFSGLGVADSYVCRVTEERVGVVAYCLGNSDNRDFSLSEQEKTDSWSFNKMATCYG